MVTANREIHGKLQFSKPHILETHKEKEEKGKIFELTKY